MKTLITIVLFIITLTANGQITRRHIKNHDSIIPPIMLVSTAATVHFMKTPPEYYGNDRLMHIRMRQRATVALTGMAATTITYFVVKNIRHKVRRNKVYKR